MDENVSGRAHRRVVNHSSTGMYASKLPGQGSVVRPSVEAGEGKSDAEARDDHGELPDHDTASRALRTLAPWDVTRLEMAPPPSGSVRTPIVTAFRSTSSGHRSPSLELSLGRSSHFTGDCHPVTL